MTACAQCLGRAWLLGRLAGHLDLVRDRIGPLLELSDEDLVAAVGGKSRAQVLCELRGFDPGGAGIACAAAGLEAICRCDMAYPRLLSALAAPPAVLYVGGGLERALALLAEQPVAIVGARRPSPYGVEVARSLARSLAAAAVTVISGMARGIDAAAHEGALEIRAVDAGAPDAPTADARAPDACAPDACAPGACAPHACAPHACALDARAADARAVTIAVLPGGADRPYPASARRLHRRIAARGAVISELPPNTRVRRWMFPARNRIIAALSAMTVVVEARAGSGALLTAGVAAELGRALGAVPGRVTSPLSGGPHELLRGGAQLIGGPQDVLDGLFGAGVRRAATPVGPSLPPQLQTLLDALADGHEMPAALGRAGLGVDAGLAALASLELAGQIRREPGGRLSVRL